MQVVRVDRANWFSRRVRRSFPRTATATEPPVPLRSNAAASVKPRILNATERARMQNKLAILQPPEICYAVEAIVDVAKQLFPRQERILGIHKGYCCIAQVYCCWNTSLESSMPPVAVEQTSMPSLFGAGWATCLTHTTEQPSPENHLLWQLLAQCHSQPVSADTRKVMLCEILHALQYTLQKEIAAELEASADTQECATVSGSDDVALLRLGGWAILSSIKYRQKHIGQNLGNVVKYGEELELLNALRLPNEDKTELPDALNYLDRGGLTFPKVELLPYLQAVEACMLEILNDKNYKRYGQRLFEVYCTCILRALHVHVSVYSIYTGKLIFPQVTKNNVIQDALLLQSFQTVATQVHPTALQSAVISVHEILCAKLYNCRCNEFLKTITHESLRRQNKSADVHVGLRDKLTD